MELTPLEQQHLLDDQEIAELKDDQRFQKYLERLREAVGRLDQEILTVKLSDWDQYLSYWYQKQALLSAIGEVSAAAKEAKALADKAAQEPDNTAATGELA